MLNWLTRPLYYLYSAIWYNTILILSPLKEYLKKHSLGCTHNYKKGIECVLNSSLNQYIHTVYLLQDKL